MDLSLILTRLKGQLTGFKEVGNAADLDALIDSVVPTPSAYLMPISESAEDNELIGGFQQRLTIGFWVVLAISNLRDTTGAAAINELTVQRTKVKAALLGWAPEPAIGEPVRFSVGHLLRFKDGVLWWVDEFRVTTYERNT
jgi:hypothetical protein